MLLSQFFKNAPAIEINQISCDSRIPMKECMFFCMKGFKYDGHAFVNEAIKNGAKVIIYEDEINTSRNAVFIRVANVSDTLNKILKKFYGYPTNSISTYIVGGCFGRLSVSTIIYKLLSEKEKSGYIGRNGILFNETSLMSSYPTLTALDNQKYLRMMADADVKNCVFESSAMNLSYKKLDAVNPKVFVYTVTDKLSGDYREMGSDYFDVLRRYFYSLDDDVFVVLNRNDISFNEFKDSVGKNLVTYGEDINSDFVIGGIVTGIKGTDFTITHNGVIYHFKTRLLGKSSVYNLTAALVSLHTQGYSFEALQPLTEKMKYIGGVMEPIENESGYNVIIDNGFTSKSLENLFEFSDSITDDKHRTFSIISVNYTDDYTRLKKSFEIAEQRNDLIILTENYSYNSNVNDILSSAEKILTKSNHLLIEDRKVAIEQAIDLMKKGDTLLITGKGNENYLTRSLGREYYSGDKYYAQKYLRERIKEDEYDDGTI